MNLRNKNVTAAIAAITMLGTLAPTAMAQTRTRGGFLHRHRGLATIGAGVAAHHYAKRSGRGNFAGRHPFLTGAAAAAGTHHILRHRTR